MLVLVLVLVLEAWAEDIGNATCRPIVIDAPLQAGAWNAFPGAPARTGRARGCRIRPWCGLAKASGCLRERNLG
ncbi:hypothetical protein [Xanthomonas euroxanthea]|uniref:hypothetical protein n=1 Tax=Xanthomonas euroxanthea TaxID=2259622 RepID=UPI0015F298E2|nr:hypothetical protein [Xanthomonas euroxanthea]CAE1135523.1 hypothetical protein XTG_001767 [Xanthomonas euroxanthea]